MESRIIIFRGSNRTIKRILDAKNYALNHNFQVSRFLDQVSAWLNRLEKLKSIMGFINQLVVNVLNI